MASSPPSNEFQLRFPPKDGISSAKFSRESLNLLLVSCWDSNVHLYHVGDNAEKAKYQHKAAVLDCVLPKDNKAFSGGLDREVKSFDFEKAEEKVLGTHDKAIRKVEYSNEHRMLVTGSWDGTCKVWDDRSGNPCMFTLQQPGKVFALALSSSRLVVGTSGRHVWIYDLRRFPQPEQRRESSLKFQTRAIACYPNGEGYAVSSVEGRVAMEYFDPSPESQSRKYAFKCHRRVDNQVDVVYPVNALAFHPFGTFATGGCDGFVNVWDGANRKRLCQFRRFPTSISSLAFNRDGSRLAIASSYTFEEGDKESPPDSIFIRNVLDADVRPKPKQK